MVILGAGGHAKVIIDTLMVNGVDDIIVLDDYSKQSIIGYEISGKISDAIYLSNQNFIIAIGDNFIRKEISSNYDLNYIKCIHSSAVISPNTSIGEGSVVSANAVINCGSSIGKHCIINTGAIVEHDNHIGNYVHISPGVKLGGNVTIGDGSWIGIGATVRNNIRICNNVIVGAGAVVISDITSPGVYVGIPAKLNKKL